ncbi:MAG: deoxynucleoside kinase [Clostridiales bacterium]|nr:deoxynucleoside kinase [Clostridiales bacterium]
MEGKLIVIEGLDGSGKATQAEFLYQELCNKSVSVRKVSFPDYESRSSSLVKMYLNGEFGDHPDDVNAYAASSFYAVDRYASYKKDWKGFLDTGGIVIADRYTTSNAVHQCSKLPKEKWDEYLRWLFDYEYRLLGIPEPALTCYLHVDPEVSQKLMSKRYQGDEQKKDIHEKDFNYLKRSQDAAGYCVDKLGWKVIECCKDGIMRSMDEIHSEIMMIVRGLSDVI